MKLKLAIAAVVLLAAGFLVATLGIAPIAASDGHFRITELFLQYGKHRAVAMQSRSVELPPLDAEWMVLKGAGHYEIGCRPCHGSPGFPPPPVATAMMPPPPELEERVKYYEPRELFWIVKHGIKFTGMPAWPALNRDDEVASVVAFLRKWPGLDRKGYEALVYGDMPREGAVAPIEELGGKTVPRSITASCSRCHGSDGLSRGSPAFPMLAGQKLDYLTASLIAYRDGQRHSGLMQPIAAGLDDDAVQEAARYYAKLKPPRAREGLDAAAIERGRKLAEEGVPQSRVPACAQCHDPARETNPQYPRLDGQWPEYLVLQLELFSKNGRGGTQWAHLMDRAIHRLEPEQMRDVAAFYGSR